MSDIPEDVTAKAIDAYQLLVEHTDACNCKDCRHRGQTYIARAILQERERAEQDAKRYRWLRADNAYVPEEELVRGGEELDRLCDEGIASAIRSAKP